MFIEEKFSKVKSTLSIWFPITILLFQIVFWIIKSFNKKDVLIENDKRSINFLMRTLIEKLKIDATFFDKKIVEKNKEVFLYISRNMEVIFIISLLVDDKNIFFSLQDKRGISTLTDKLEIIEVQINSYQQKYLDEQGSSENEIV